MQARDLISDASKSNPFSEMITAAIPAQKAWVALGWRHFLYWFADAEHRIETGGVSADDLVNIADENWGKIKKPQSRHFSWKRDPMKELGYRTQWRRALVEFPYLSHDPASR